MPGRSSTPNTHSVHARRYGANRVESVDTQCASETNQSGAQLQCQRPILQIDERFADKRTRVTRIQLFFKVLLDLPRAILVIAAHQRTMHHWRVSQIAAVLFHERAEGQLGRVHHGRAHSTRRSEAAPEFGWHYDSLCSGAGGREASAAMGVSEASAAPISMGWAHVAELAGAGSAARFPP